MRFFFAVPVRHIAQGLVGMHEKQIDTRLSTHLVYGGVVCQPFRSGGGTIEPLQQRQGARRDAHTSIWGSSGTSQLSRPSR